MFGLILSFVFSLLGAFAGAATAICLLRRGKPMQTQIKPAPAPQRPPGQGEKQVTPDNFTRRKQEWLFGTKDGEE